VTAQTLHSLYLIDYLLSRLHDKSSIRKERGEKKRKEKGGGIGITAVRAASIPILPPLPALRYHLRKKE